MKRILHLLVALLIVAPTAFATPEPPKNPTPKPGTTQGDKSETVILYLDDIARSGKPVIHAPGKPGHRPRAALTIFFTTDLGLATVELSNEETGEYVQATVDTDFGEARIPFSGRPGTWTITITFADGEVDSWVLVL